ncbi:MAG: DUF975 family protein [Candidatus Paralactobacillus gallistercoris]|uniref:DUF975 family protein n=1 Tax=Candidatus Paralactobacillus gallistercoris TaxID=2838724 RepID=A0A948TJK8_9LACO|nr:DUF975 family protein [Candidatus Paralactobacillus gallistercoris]
MQERRKQFKITAKQILKGNWGKCALLMLVPFLIYALPMLLKSVTSTPLLMYTEPLIPITTNIVFMVALLVLIWIMTGIKFYFLDWYHHFENERTGKFHSRKHPIKASFQIFKQPYFDGTWAVIGVTTIMTLLWGLLFIIPGVIKAISYSQALFIYKDHVTAGEHVSALQCLHESEVLMNGHKWEYCVLLLSFVGWLLLSLLSLGIGLLWVLPYQNLTIIAFYDYLRLQTNMPATKDMVAEQIRVQKEALHA